LVNLPQPESANSILRFSVAVRGLSSRRFRTRTSAGRQRYRLGLPADDPVDPGLQQRAHPRVYADGYLYLASGLKCSLAAVRRRRLWLRAAHGSQVVRGALVGDGLYVSATLVEVRWAKIEVRVMPVR